MAKYLNDAQVAELNRKRGWCLTIIGYLRTVEESPVFDDFAKAVNEIYAIRDLRQMRGITRDMNEWARELTTTHMAELNGQLRERFGEDLDSQTARDIAMIDRIRNRGAIRTKREYRLVRERAEEIWDDDDKKEEMEALNKLLADFERPC
jgi:hypothetical protein